MCARRARPAAIAPGQVRDKYGRKMSKSLGNVIDPLEVQSPHISPYLPPPPAVSYAFFLMLAHADATPIHAATLRVISV